MIWLKEGSRIIPTNTGRELTESRRVLDGMVDVLTTSQNGHPPSDPCVNRELYGGRCHVLVNGSMKISVFGKCRGEVWYQCTSILKEAATSFPTVQSWGSILLRNVGTFLPITRTLTWRHIPQEDLGEDFYSTNCYRLISSQLERSYDHWDGIMAYFTTIPIAIPCALAYLFRHSA